MAFRKKAKYLQEYDADILVIQESENLGQLDIPELKDYTQRIWMGKGPHKGGSVGPRQPDHTLGTLHWSGMASSAGV